MAMRLFYVKDFYIVTKHKENWKAVKGMLDIPIWKKATEEPKDHYKEELKKEIKKIQKKGLSPEKKMEEVKELKKRLKLKHEIGTVRTTYRTFLKAMGDLMCERGNPPALTSSSIVSKFKEVANGEYDDFFRILKNRVKKQKIKDKLKEKRIKEYKEKVEAKKKEHFDNLKHIKKRKKTSRKQKEGLDVKDRIDRLNTWLKKYGNAIFVKKVGEDYKLLVYRAEGNGEQELFCSRKNEENFLEIINEKGRKKEQFEGIEYLKPFENVLKASPYESIEYFRILGPLDEHFEKGWMYRRDEVGELRKKIENTDSNNFQLLTGDAASGKTVIARNIVYDLMNKGWKVYGISVHDVVEEGKRKSIRWGLDYLENIANKVLVIIEDVHKESRNFASILEWIVKNDLKTRFLLTARESYKIGLIREQIDIFDRCDKKDLNEVDFSSLADDIIATYIKNQDYKRRKVFKKFTLEHRDKIKEEANGNLWILAYFLRAWTPEKGIDMEILYDLVNKDFEDLEKEFKNKYKLHGVAEALLFLAPFSQFEISVSELFLDEKFGSLSFNSSTLDKLSEYGEIGHENGFYTLPHSALAQLYMETVLLTKGKKNLYLLKNIIKHQRNYRLSGGANQYPLNMLHMYLQSMPINYYQLMRRITSFERSNIVYNLDRIFWPYKKWKPSRREFYYKFTITKNLLQNKQTMNSLVQLISEEKDLYKIFIFIQTISFSSLEKKSKIFGAIINEDLCSKIEKAKTSDVNNLLFLINFIGAHSEKGTRDLYKSQLKKINPSVMKEKLISEPHLFESCFLIYNLFCIDKRFIEYLKDIALEKIKKYLKIEQPNSFEKRKIFKPLIEALYELENINKREIDKIDELLDSKMMVLHNFYD